MDIGQTENNTKNASQHYMVLDVCTQFHRITGEVLTTSLRTNGALNSEDAHLMLERASTGSLVRPQDQPIVSGMCRVTKAAIVFAVPNEEAENDRLAHRLHNFGYRELLQHRVLIGLGNFEISGDLHLEHELALNTVLLDRAETFIGVTSVSILYLPNPGLKFAASTVLINKNYVNFVSAGAP